MHAYCRLVLLCVHPVPHSERLRAAIGKAIPAGGKANMLADIFLTLGVMGEHNTELLF
jgi:hypothetical protein